MTAKRWPIFLSGFMGAGKSSVGPLLAELLECQFIDTDVMFEADTGLSPAVFLRDRGEELFRERESEILYGIRPGLQNVVSLGGGAILLQKNREYLRRVGRWVYLEASAKILSERLVKNAGVGIRPLLDGLQGEALENQIQTLLRFRAPFYEEAEFKLSTDHQSEKQVAHELWVMLR